MKLGLLVTNDCNLGCSYCYSPKQNLTVDLDSAIALLEHVLTEIPESECLELGFIGGECFLKPRLMADYLAYASKRLEQHPGGWFCSATTNGTLLGTEAAMALLERYKDRWSIGVSIDGGKILHDANRIYSDGSGSCSGSCMARNSA